MKNYKFTKNKNRINFTLTVVLILLSAVMLCSCNFDFASILSEKPTESVQATTEPATESTAKFKPPLDIKTSYSYDNLSSDKLREIYVIIDEYAESADTSAISLDVLLDEKDIEETIEAYKNDHPEVFWLSSTFYYISDPISRTTSVELTYRTEASELDNAKAKFKKALKKALDSAPKNATDYELELYANNYLVDNCVYDEEAVKTEEIIGHENDAYGALVDKKAVCEGYSRAFQLLCNKLGVECINISGTADGESHAWNNVKLDGEWYEVDVTWNDTDGDTEFPIYDFFNLPSDKFSKSHSAASLYSELSASEYEKTNTYHNIFSPECTGTKYYYYSYSCVTLYDINNGEKISEAIAQAAKNGNEYFDFVIDESLDYNSTTDKIIYDGYLADWISNANLANWYNPTLNQEARVFSNEEYKLITVIFEYI